MTYPEAIQFLYSLRMFGTKLGLGNTFKLAELAGKPQDKLRFIHVAGTNGKGSTCAMLESIYRAAGLRVGLFTSPHLVSFGERIQVNRKPISEDEVVRLVSELQPLLETFPADAHPTFFEVITVMALRYFAEQKCELVIWETGLGGRLDATNIVTPLASVITTIALDHEKWLGSTLNQIAAEKAGIIKPGVPVMTSASPGQGLEEIVAASNERGSPLVRVNWQDTQKPPLSLLELPLHGEFQRLNAALAITTVRVLANPLPIAEAHSRTRNKQHATRTMPSVAEELIREALSHVHWPGRMQLVQRANGQTILLDGAHNPAGVEALCTEAAKRFPGVKPTLILGILADKDWKTMSALLAPLAGRLVLTPVQSERNLASADLLLACQTASPQVPIVACSSLAETLAETEADQSVIITGSLYLVGEAMELLGLSPAPAKEERSLNEWGRAGIAAA